MLVSISEGDCLDGLLGAILLRAADDMMAVGCRERGSKRILRKDLEVEYSGGNLARKCAVRALCLRA
jgi:hypothetical protein